MLVIFSNAQIYVISRALMFEYLDRHRVIWDMEDGVENRYYLEPLKNEIAGIDKLLAEAEMLGDNEDRKDYLDSLGQEIVENLLDGKNDVSLSAKEMDVIFCALQLYRKIMTFKYYNENSVKEKIASYNTKDIDIAFRLSFIMHRLGIWPFSKSKFTEDEELDIIRNGEYWESEYEIVTETINIINNFDQKI